MKHTSSFYSNLSLLAAGFFSKGHLDAWALTGVYSSRTQKSGMAVWPSREEDETRKNRPQTVFLLVHAAPMFRPILLLG